MWLKRLTFLAVLLACGVVVLGAYTRLQDAGLGCPDWPGCYGNLIVPQSEHAISEANAAFPHRPLESHKAWPEMIHRYLASSLGLVIFIILFLCIKERRKSSRIPLKLPMSLCLLVIFQGLLGMWTVTLGLFPTVVMLHLLGGFTTLCLLFLLAVRVRLPKPPHQLTLRPDQINPPPSPLMKWALTGIVILGLQIALGGWTAANYAATVCNELPVCQDSWQRHINVSEAFQLWGHGLDDYEHGPHLAPDAKMTIHISHRIGAMITALYLSGLFIWLLMSSELGIKTKKAAAVGLGLLLVQVLLGISNVVFELPLLVAVAHNGVAALLMMSLIFISVNLVRVGRSL